MIHYLRNLEIIKEKNQDENKKLKFKYIVVSIINLFRCIIKKMLKKKKTCKYFVKGFCRYGTNCHNSHDIIKQRDPCRYYEKKGYCNYGTECHFTHHPKLVFKTPIIVAHVTTYYSLGPICSDILLRTKDFINFEESTTIGYTFPRFNYHTLFDYRTQI
jgi:hypothetical protein